MRLTLKSGNRLVIGGKTAATVTASDGHFDIRMPLDAPGLWIERVTEKGVTLHVRTREHVHVERIEELAIGPTESIDDSREAR